MELRAIFTPPVLDEDKVRRMTILADDIISHMDSGRNPDKLIEMFNTLTDSEYTDIDFHNIAWEGDTEEFVRGVLMPGGPWVTDISREEYLEIIRRAASINLDGEANYRNNWWLYVHWMSILRRNLTHPDISNIVLSGDNTPEEALDKILMHKPIAL
ncbi:MAG: hypothetical protein ABIY70_12690 [Capsulimonas sp.]|uniref:hypothetical protein n=1 Tax=Capsulimonas sp. TaxID=2494211 RepID=UPI0032669DE7